MVINNQAVRKALALLNNCTYSVLEYEGIIDPITGIVKHGEVPKQGGLPGKISFSTVKQAQEGEVNATAQQVIKLFYEPHIEVKPGSKIVVAHKGQIYNYKNSGEPSKFESHNELLLEKFIGWA